MRVSYSVADIRQAEAGAMAVVGPDELMQRAASGLARVVRQLLAGLGRPGKVTGLVGSGNNGGDTLFALTALARRGISCTAIAMSADIHDAGRTALLRAGGRIVSASDDGAQSIVSSSDIVLDGIVGIGGSGAVRAPALGFLPSLAEPTTTVVAVDLPSGISADTGAVADDAAVVQADFTVTFGGLKNGLLLPPGRDFCGQIEEIDIGLAEYLPDPALVALQAVDVGRRFAPPQEDAYKYSHGILGVIAGSKEFPGAGSMVAGAARHCGVGMVRIADRGDGVADQVVERFPDVVTAAGPDFNKDPRATAWTVGPGAGIDHVTAGNIANLAGGRLPLLLDADALTLLAKDEDLRAAIRQREAPTVVTPHVGEFRRLGFQLTSDRVADAVGAAQSLNCVVVLKGPGTIIAEPGGAAWVDTAGTAALATAGTGDVLAGIVGAALAQWQPQTSVGEQVAAGVFLHGFAARRLSQGQVPMTSWDLTKGLAAAVGVLREMSTNAAG